MSIVERTVTLIRDRVSAGKPLDVAALEIKSTYKLLTRECLDMIGSYPSSEPELCALQRVA